METMPTTHKGVTEIERWFKQRDWHPFPFQRETWEAYLRQENGILNAPTGSGKTYALWLGCLAEYIQETEDIHQPQKNGLRLLWITPLRALAKDLQRAMQEACDEIGIPWRVAMRTGDTSSSERQKQKKNMPECLITTPESLHLMLAQKRYDKLFLDLRAVVADEWHELIGNKRGVQVELGLSRLRAICPKLRTWGISATIGNLEEAGQVLIGPNIPPEKLTIVRAKNRKRIEVESILPDEVEKFPWAGHLGTNMIGKILPIIEKSPSTLLFTNTRAQAEIWYQKILEKAPELAGIVAMHHGSLDNQIRTWVEDALHEGRLKLVVCTSSLDLGVDFRPVETVIQIGGPKGVNRFLQRAGRSGHQPDALSRIYFLPTHSLELLEGAALAQAVREVTEEGNLYHLESRHPILKPLDVLVQYLVTLAVSDGFLADETYVEIKNTHAYQHLSQEEWDWALQFITSGGESLDAYEEFDKVWVNEGRYHVKSRRVAMRHRLSMGTIVSEPAIKIKYVSGGFVGTVEEYFISNLKRGDVFWFAGKSLEFVRMEKMTALVRRSKRKTGKVPRWLGGRLPLSSELAQLIRKKMQGYRHSQDVEIQTISPILELQDRWSKIPDTDEFLIEEVRTDEGFHVFFYPFQGRLVHEVMAALVCYRISQLTPISFSFAMNDYGFEILSDSEIPLEYALELDLFTTDDLLFDIKQSLNEAEMAKRRFREIAAISGLIFQGYPGKNIQSKHLQASAQLLFDVFSEYDPDNLLIRQAFREVIDMQLEQDRLAKAMETIRHQKIVVKRPPKVTPFAFPILIDRLRERISSETIEQRVAKMQLQLERYAEEGE